MYIILHCYINFYIILSLLKLRLCSELLEERSSSDKEKGTSDDTVHESSTDLDAAWGVHGVDEEEVG